MICPTWEDMPKCKPVVTLCWKDIYYTAEVITQKKFNRCPTQKEIKELFHYILHKDIENATFWGTLEYYCLEYYDEVKK